MRKFVLIILLLSSAVYGQNTKPMPGEMIDWGHPLSRGLVGCWLFNEGTGDKICDSSGNNYGGTFASSTNKPSWTNYKFGHAIDFDGDDYIEIDDPAITGGHPQFSVSMWIKSDVASGANTHFIQQWNNPYTFRFLWDQYGRVSFGISADDSVGGRTSMYTMNDTNWHHLVGVYDGANVYVYLDKAVGSTVGSTTGVTDTNTKKIQIGHHPSYGNLDGKISHVMMWSRALSLSDIDLLYRQPFCMFESSNIANTYFAADTSDWLGINSSHIDSFCGENLSATLAGALDGTSDWYHGAYEIHWFILDLGAVYNISKVRGRSWSEVYDPTNVNIYVSNSKTVWGTAVASGITTWQDRGDWNGNAVIDCTAKNGRYIKVEITSTEGGNPGYLDFGEEYGPPFFKIFDAYGYYVSGVEHPQIILIQMSAIPLLVLAFCILIKTRSSG